MVSVSLVFWAGSGRHYWKKSVLQGNQAASTATK